MKFQSSRPVWSETSGRLTPPLDKEISILSPRVERDPEGRKPRAGNRISILSPRVERDSNVVHSNPHYHVNIAQVQILPSFHESGIRCAICHFSYSDDTIAVRGGGVFSENLAFARSAHQRFLQSVWSLCTRMLDLAPIAVLSLGGAFRPRPRAHIARNQYQTLLHSPALQSGCEESRPSPPIAEVTPSRFRIPVSMPSPG